MWHIPPINEEKDPEIIAALKRMEKHEEADRREEFDQLYEKLVALWGQLSASSAVKGFATIRDKVSAHTEVRLIADKYRLVDIGRLGIKFGDLRSTIDDMQNAVELIGLIVRNTGFAWDMLKEQLSEAAAGFWRT